MINTMVRRATCNNNVCSGWSTTLIYIAITRGHQHDDNTQVQPSVFNFTVQSLRAMVNIPQNTEFISYNLYAFEVSFDSNLKEIICLSVS